MKKGILGLAAVGLLFLSMTANAVVVTSRTEWRQLTETTGFSWNDINSVCGNGLCSGGVGELATLNGWYWADNGRVRALFEALIRPGTLEFSDDFDDYEDIHEPDIEAAVGGLFLPTATSYGGGIEDDYEMVIGWSRTYQEFGSLGYTPALEDWLHPLAEDWALLSLRHPAATAFADVGVWLFRPVPEPGTLALIGAALLAVLVSSRCTPVVAASCGYSPSYY